MFPRKLLFLISFNKNIAGKGGFSSIWTVVEKFRSGVGFIRSTILVPLHMKASAPRWE